MILGPVRVEPGEEEMGVQWRIEKSMTKATGLFFNQMYKAQNNGRSTPAKMSTWLAKSSSHQSCWQFMYVLRKHPHPHL